MGILKAIKMHITQVSSLGYIVEKTKFPTRIFVATSVITFYNKQINYNIYPPKKIQ